MLQIKGLKTTKQKVSCWNCIDDIFRCNSSSRSSCLYTFLSIFNIIGAMAGDHSHSQQHNTTSHQNITTQPHMQHHNITTQQHIHCHKHHPHHHPIHLLLELQRQAMSEGGLSSSRDTCSTSRDTLQHQKEDCQVKSLFLPPYLCCVCRGGE